MRKISSMLLATAMFAVGPMASADETGQLAVGFKAGTLGFGVDLNYPISPRLNVGVGINKYSASSSDTTSGIDYDVDLNLQTISLLANFHPFAGTFRITAGAMINSNELGMKAKPGGGGTYDIGGATYTEAEVGVLKASVDFNKFAPYAGLGWGTSSDSGLGFTLDIGVLMQGKPKVDFSATGGTLTADPTFQADLKQEEANAENDIKGFTMYPVVSAGLNFRF